MPPKLACRRQAIPERGPAAELDQNFTLSLSDFELSGKG
jgi:hypothetical protein